MKSKKQAPPAAWWNFAGSDEAFEARQPDRWSRLYFPLCNEAGLLSAVTPTLNGDIKTGQNCFVTLPVSEQDLHNTRSARNFWIYTEKKGAWSAGGMSAWQVQERSVNESRSGETTVLRAGALWHRIERRNTRLGLKAEILNFIPAGSDRLEIMQVTITNLSRQAVTISATAAIPLFARSADNLRDHRHVTSLLHRIEQPKAGVLVRPTMSFDERGHKLNHLVYGVLGVDDQGELPIGSFPTVDSFIGEGGSFDAPRAVLQDLDPPDLRDVELQGREAVGALRFKARKLSGGKSATFLVFIGVADDRKEALAWIRTYGTPAKTEEALAHTRQFWKERLDRLQVETADPDFGRWMRWVELQPILRKIFGNSFLPDFDYGRGGRGWRDLWQDCLGLLLIGSDPTGASDRPTGPQADARPAESQSVRDLLLNNFAGIRPNGTNATIIGKAPGEFLADRNGISRTWMDHGVWPWITTEFYLHQTGDWKILLENAPYFWDQDKKLGAGDGTVLEHLLVQHLTAWHDAGPRGHLRLADADWNDGLDMAHEKGESVAFTAVYAGNMRRMADVLERLDRSFGLHDLALAEELSLLLQGAGGRPDERQDRLRRYRAKTAAGVSGRKGAVTVESVIHDLRAKAEALAAAIRTDEWVKDASGHCWFNGYYDNASNRVEGLFDGQVRMTLTGQVFPIMSGVATNEQVQQSYAAARRYLKDRSLGGFRLNTDFADAPLTLGRAFAFAYGEKENGAFFSHMNVMFANALYRRGFVDEGYEVLNSVYRMAMDAGTARIYPGLPEYFNGEGRGMYHYLTGSASWYLLTLVTEVLGVRGEWGDLVLEPKLVPEQFGAIGRVQAWTSFAGKRLHLTYLNPARKSYGQYRVQSVLLQGKTLPKVDANRITIPRQDLTAIAAPEVEITVALG